MADATALEDRLAALEEAIGLAQGRLDAELVERARAVLVKARERLTTGPQAVVVALGGGTGSGKSSLFNALAGEDLSRVGAVRPVTGEVISLSVGDDEATTAVLDWLDVRRRHVALPGTKLPDGLVLLDLPDHDSVVSDHRAVVDRFVERVDVFVWVVDPLKYAQRALHDDYLKLLAAHARVVVVTLNQVDALGRDDRIAVLDDLRRIMDAEGLQRARLLVTSARSGEGIADLRDTITQFVERRRAVAQRIAGDVGNVASALATQVGPPRAVSIDNARLAAALTSAAGVEPLADAGRRTYADEANDATRPLLTGAVLRRLRRVRNPLRPLGRPGGGQRSPVSPIGVRHAVAELVERASDGLPHPWPSRLHAAGQAAAGDLPAAVSGGIDRVDVHRVPRRAWWPLARVAGTFLEAAIVLGVVWLTMLAAVEWLRLPEPPTPHVGAVPVPTLLALGGVLAYAALGVVRRRLVAAGARRHRNRIGDELTAAVGAVSEETAVAPLRTELEAHATLAATLRRAAGRPV